MVNFIVSIIFENDDVYNHYYQSIKESQKEEIEKYSQNVHLLKNKSTSDFKINDKFTLDFKTYLYLQANLPFSEMQPYGLSIKYLKSIKDKKTPTSKMKAIIKAEQKLMSSINQFYTLYGKKFDRIIDSDELLKI
jgi:hypothetical protein